MMASVDEARVAEPSLPRRLLPWSANGIYDLPRIVLDAVPSTARTELPQHGEQSFCCGTGGGLMWSEERAGTRVNVPRTEEVLAAGPEVVGTACPFCLSMFEDGTRVKDATEPLRALEWPSWCPERLTGPPFELEGPISRRTEQGPRIWQPERPRSVSEG